MPLYLTNQAINAALNNNWQEAIRINLKILTENPKDVEALNRLGRTYKETGKVELAQKTYRKVLKIDRFNPIAIKNLKLLETFPKSFKKTPSSNNDSYHPQIFLEEPGKTKVVNLINLAPASTLLTLSCGDQANLLIKRRAITVIDSNRIYLGALPDDISAKLINLIKGGNRYEAFIKTVAKKSLSVFIREVYRAPRFKNQPTFPVTSGKSHFFGRSEPLSSTEEPTPDLGEETLSEEEPSEVA